MEYHCKPGICCAAVLCLVLVVVVSMTMTSATVTWINGPEPMTVVAPLGTTVTFTCVVNTTELPVGTSLFGFGWIVNHAKLSGSSDQESTDGSLEISTLQLPVITSVLVQCQVAVLVSGTLMPLLSNNATLKAYGEI